MTPFNYFVTYGQAAFLGCFRAEKRLERDARVVVLSPRGSELGTVLSEATTPLAANFQQLAQGEVLRSATNEDERHSLATKEPLEGLLKTAGELAEEMGLPLLFLDGEILLDGTAVLQAIHWADCDATPIFTELSRRYGAIVKLHDATAPAKVEKKSGCETCGSEGGGCSTGGCSTTGGGCSTGSCSKGAVKSAAELTEYFGELRQQMEKRQARVPLN